MREVKQSCIMVVERAREGISNLRDYLEVVIEVGRVVGMGLREVVIDTKYEDLSVDERTQMIMGRGRGEGVFQRMTGAVLGWFLAIQEAVEAEEVRVNQLPYPQRVSTMKERHPWLKGERSEGKGRETSVLD